MTKLSIYQKHEGREDIHLSKYYKADYLRLQILKTIIAVSVGTVLIVALFAVYYSEFLLDNALYMNYKALGRTILGYYLVLLVVYIGITIIAYSIAYTKSRKRLTGFYHSLTKLRKFEEEEEQIREMEKEEREDAEE